MSDNCDNSSVVDNLIILAGMMMIISIIFMAIPILPYFDILIKIVLSIHTPTSFLGKFLTGAGLLMVAYVMYIMIKSIGEAIFKNTMAMYMFLYGQALFVMSLLSKSDGIFFFSKIFVAFLSAGFDEPKEFGYGLLLTIGIILACLGVIIEFFSYLFFSF